MNYSASVTFARRPHYGDKFVNMMDSRERVAFSRQLIESNVAYPYVQSWVGYEAAIKDYWEDRISFSEMRRRVSRAESLNTDWFDLLTRNSWSQKHTVSLSGGSSTMKYYVSLGLNDARGNIRGEKDKTYTANANLTANFGRFGFRFGMNASTQDKDYTPSSVNVLGYAYNTSRHSFRIQNTSQSRYMACMLETAPVVDRYVKVTVETQGISSIPSQELQALVLKISQGKVWLWDETKNTGLIIRLE